MRSLCVLAVLASVSGCVTTAEGFHCATSDQCGASGMCEASGHCSFADVSCTSGRRFSAYAGAQAELCTESLVPTPNVDAGGDAGATPDVLTAPINLLADPGFELQAGASVGSPWTMWWQTTQVQASGAAASGTHNILQAPPPGNSVEMYQEIAVTPNTAYVYSARLDTHSASTSPTSGDAFIIEVRTTSNAQLVESFPAPTTSNGYVTRTIGFNSGANSVVRIFVKTWNNDAAQGDTWMRADDLVVRPQ